MIASVRVILLVSAASLVSDASARGASCAGHGSTGAHGHPSCTGATHGMGFHAHGGARVCAGGGFYDPAIERDLAGADRELHERVERTRRAQEGFARQNPCPANGLQTTVCPGYLVECAAPDPALPDRCFDAANLQWRKTRRPRRFDGAGGRLLRR